MTEVPSPFEFDHTVVERIDPPLGRHRRQRRLGVVLAVSIGLPVLAAGGVLVYLFVTGAFADPEPPQLTASQSARIEEEVAERVDLLTQLDDQRDLYNTRKSDWDQSLQWANEHYATTTAPTPQVANPGGDAMPGDDPYGRAFLDSIGATDVTVLFDAGPENCGYAGDREYGYVYSGGCFNSQYPNTLFMAWDPGAEDSVWPIFVHEAMHWFQDTTYLQDEYLADFAGIDPASYNERWEADASCRAVYVYGIPLDDYVDTSSPCTIDGWYEGFIADHLTSLGAHLAEPLPADFEVEESSRP